MLARLVASVCLPTVVSFVCSLWLACFACFLGLGYSILLACLVACLLVCLLGCLLLLASAYFCLLLLALRAIVLASFSPLPVSLAYLLACLLACLPACLLACWQKQDEAEFKMKCAFRFACYPGLQAEGGHKTHVFGSIFRVVFQRAAWRCFLWFCLGFKVS